MFSKLARITSFKSVAKLSQTIPKQLNGRILFKLGSRSVQRTVVSNISGKPRVPVLADLELRDDQTTSHETDSNLHIENVHEGEDSRYVTVSWNNGTISRYPYIFLRDNCKCPQCFEHKSNQSLLHTIVDVGLNIEAKKASFSEDGQRLICEWPEGHVSEYPLEWLRHNRMPEKHELDSGRKLNTDSLVKDELILWDREMLQCKIPCFDYEAVMNDDQSLFEYLYALYQYGLVLLDDGPVKELSLLDMATRLGWFKNSYLGDVNDVKVVDDPPNVGCTTKRLYFHTDLPYLRSTPDIQALHCLQQSPSGGKSTFVDGFHVVKQLQRDNPDAFEILTTFPMRFYDEGAANYGEYCFGFSAPMINLNKHGRLENILCNPLVMTAANSKSTTEEVLKFYNAYYQLSKAFYDNTNAIEVRLKPGQIALMHNTRVLHGRTAFEPTAASGVRVTRWLQGTYYEWDLVFSKLRVLHRNLGLKTPHLHTESNDFF